MSGALEHWMLAVSQWFLLPVLVLICAVFIYSLFMLGVTLTQALQRLLKQPSGFDLLRLKQQKPEITKDELELIAYGKLEMCRTATRVAPMLGLVATMIPMGPAMQSLSDGELNVMASALSVAFSAVILSLLAAVVCFCCVRVHRHWFLHEMQQISENQA